MDYILALIGIAVAGIFAFFYTMKKRATPEPVVQEELPEPEPLPEIKPSMPEKIYEFAKSCLGKDIAKTQSELGCAEAVSYVLVHTVIGFPVRGFLSTFDLYQWLMASPQFVLADGPEPGDVIISPTGFSSKGAVHGHVGIVAKFGILSNNSMTGIFDEYYKIATWEAYYRERLGFPVYYFRAV